MIAARQIAFGKAAGGGLPDGVIPVEYLEARSVWQNNIIPVILMGEPAFNRISVKFCYTYANDADIKIYGNPKHSSRLSLAAYYGAFRGTEIPFSTGNWYEVEQSNNPRRLVIKSGGVEYETEAWWLANGDSKSMFAIFAASLDDGRIVNEENGVRINCSFGTTVVRYEYFKGFSDGVLVRDLIPVLYYGVPCMYDKVSGEFFYNAGTGEFIAGPIKEDVEYSARDYIQDGLVALVDGIENAGWEKHTDELEYVNLVTGEQFTLPNNGNAVWGEDCLKILESGDRASGLQTGFTFSADTLGITSEAKEYTIECALKAYDTNFPVVSFDGAFGRALGTPSSDAFQGSVSSAYLPDSNYFQWSVNGDIRNKFNSAVVQEDFEGFFWNNREAYAGRLLSFGRSYNSVCKSDIHCARIYNRALTAEEIAYNYKIDRARFNLP